MEIIVSDIEYLSQCCGFPPFGEMFTSADKSGVCGKCGRCGKCLENTMFEIVCPECQGSNLSEDETTCWDCKAGDYV